MNIFFSGDVCSSKEDFSTFNKRTFVVCISSSDSIKSSNTYSIGRGSIGDDYATMCGYNELADLNDIVMLYPQTVKSPLVPYNPNGCFDWWGYTNANYGQVFVLFCDILNLVTKRAVTFALHLFVYPFHSLTSSFLNFSNQ